MKSFSCSQFGSILISCGFMLVQGMVTGHAQPVIARKTHHTQNVILITMDGLRWREIFTGADSLLVRNKSITRKAEFIRKKYWRAGVPERRKALMPFFWEILVRQGQLYGNRDKGSFVNVSNQYWFSYPGYSELFCGFADDSVNSNDLRYNPDVSLLEVLNETEGFKGKVAAFSSWDAFPYILNDKRSGIMVNSAFQPQSPATDNIRMLNEIQTQLPDLIPGVRLDAVTFYQGFEYLKRQKPRMLFIGFDETDDFAHQGKYDMYLGAIHHCDRLIGKLWKWIQSDSAYRNKTTLLITADHGRGVGDPGWRDHGREIPHSDETWLAVIGPDTPPTGELTDSGQYYSNQFAQTIAALLGISYIGQRQTGNYIPLVIGDGWERYAQEDKDKKEDSFNEIRTER